jgi:hypothetical protein
LFTISQKFVAISQYGISPVLRKVSSAPVICGMCWLACLPRMVSTFFASPASWFALPKKNPVLSNSLAHSRNCRSPVSR